MQILYQSNCKSTQNALDTKPWKGCENRDSTAAKSMKISRVIAGGVILFLDELHFESGGFRRFCLHELMSSPPSRKTFQRWKLLCPKGIHFRQHYCSCSQEKCFNVGNVFFISVKSSFDVGNLLVIKASILAGLVFNKSTLQC